jgi:hypothetical protein
MEIPQVMNRDRGEPRYEMNMDEADAFTQAISLQAARAARFAKHPPLSYFERQQAIRQIDLQERVSRLLRLFKLVLALAIGTTVYAGVMYFFLGMNLRPPPPSPSVTAATPPLPPQSATPKRATVVDRAAPVGRPLPVPGR